MLGELSLPGQQGTYFGRGNLKACSNSAFESALMLSCCNIGEDVSSEKLHSFFTWRGLIQRALILRRKFKSQLQFTVWPGNLKLSMQRQISLKVGHHCTRLKPHAGRTFFFLNKTRSGQYIWDTFLTRTRFWGAALKACSHQSLQLASGKVNLSFAL